jgi:uncharacterized delta-60 repeat protein
MSFSTWFESVKSTWGLNSLGPTRRRSPLRQRASSLSVQAAEVMEERRLLSGGALDPTFGTGGILTTDVGTDTGHAYAVATYAQTGTANDGKIIVGGYNYRPNSKIEFALVRYNLDGSLDKSFGGTGEVVGPMGRVRAVAIQPDGKILAAGMSGNDFAIARYNANGSSDTTFGSRGVATTGIGASSFDEILAMGLQSDGKIVVVGGTSPANSITRELVVARYNANGSLDTTFGKGGEALDHLTTSVLQGGATQGMGLAIDPTTNAIVVQAADSAGNAMVVRYTSNGKLDTTFAGTGYETLANLHSYAAVAIQPSDHRIVVVGGYHQSVVRLNPDGTPDTTFGVSGIVATSFIATQYSQSVTIQSDGRIVAAATNYNEFNEFMVTRFNSADGSLDTSFGANGIAAVSRAAFPKLSTEGAMALEPDGRIVVAGTTGAGTVQFVVARFLAQGPQIGSFTATPLAAGQTATLTAASISDGIPNGAIAQVALYVDSNADERLDPGTDTLLGYAIQTSPGVWSLAFAVNLSPGKYTFFAQAEDNYGVLGDPFAITATVN